jgi:DNA-binding transcriptional MocR family regulator
VSSGSVFELRKHQSRREPGLYLCDVVVGAITRHMGNLVDVEVPESGIQLAIHFKKAISDVEVARQARLQGIAVKPISRLYLQVDPRQGLLLGYAGFDLHTLRASSKKLAHIVRKAYRADVRQVRHDQAESHQLRDPR